MLPVPRLARLFFLILTVTGCSRKTDLPSERRLDKDEVREDVQTFFDLVDKAHPAPYFYTSRAELKKAADDIFQKGGALTVRELYNKLYPLIDRIGCAHTGLCLPQTVFDSMAHRPCLFPYPVSWINNKLLVNITDGFTLGRGAEVTQVNGRPVSEIMHALGMYELTDGFQHTVNTQVSANFAFDYFARYGAFDHFSIVSVDTLGEKHTDVKEGITLEEANKRVGYRYYFDATDVPYDLSLNEEYGYAVMTLTTFEFSRGQATRAFYNFCYNSFKLLRANPRVRSLIIDLRQNPGGDLTKAASLFTYLSPDSFRTEKSMSTRIRFVPKRDLLADMDEADINELDDWLRNNFQPGARDRYVTPDSLIDSWQPDADRFRGNVFVVTDGGTASAASTFAGMVKYSGRGKVVGSPTCGGEYCGSGGERITYNLPNSGIQLFFSVAHIVHYYRNEKNTGHTLVPDILLPDNDSSFRNNKDRQVNYILDSILKTKW